MCVRLSLIPLICNYPTKAIIAVANLSTVCSFYFQITPIHAVSEQFYHADAVLEKIGGMQRY